ncbi:GNAT family N-acetyltransferase [bacterium]|nr:GNAT family N-acetyltransferase [bacterium]
MRSITTDLLGEIAVRDFRLSDYEQVIGLWREAGLPYKANGRDHYEAIQAELQRGLITFLVAEYGGEIVGTVLGTHDGRKGWINRLAVCPRFRRQGLAQHLIHEIEKKLEQQGLKVIACLIETRNQASIRCFEKLGFCQHSEIVYLTKKDHPEA